MEINNQNQPPQSGEGQPITPNAGGQGGQPPAGNPPAKTFTQEQLDQIINDRLARERAKFTDYEDLKKFREEAEGKSKSELEKLTEAKAKAEAKAQAVTEQATQRVLNAEARAIASELRFKKPDIAIKLVDLSTVIKDGEVNADEIRKSLEALAKEMPELLDIAGAPAGTPHNPPKGSEGNPETDDQRRARLTSKGNFEGWLKRGNVSNWGKQDPNAR